MNKKLKDFVSSTCTDLIEERRISTETIHNTGHVPVSMEIFNDLAESYQYKITSTFMDNSDVYILINVL